VIFPWGGGAASMVLPSQRARLRAFAEADAAPLIPHEPDPPIPACIDRAGVGRERHAWDKDRRCVFCDRRRISKWRVS
jgi:hypothetical protein